MKTMHHKFDKNIEQQFITKLKEIHPNIEIISNYQGQAIKCEFKCLKCQRYFYRQPCTMLRANNRYGCPFCNKKLNAKKHIKSKYAAINPVILRFPYLEYITGYTGSKSKPLFYCNMCQHYFKRTIYNITKSKYGCPYCSQKHMNDDKKLTKAQFIKKLHSKYPNLQTLTPYKSYRAGIELICKNCDHIFKLRKTGIIFNRNYGCPFCRDGHPEKRNDHQIYLNNQEFLLALHHRFSNFKLLNTFKSMNVPIKLKCLKCNYIWQVTPRQLFHRNIDLCPECIIWKQHCATLNCVKWFKKNKRDMETNETFYHYCQCAFKAYIGYLAPFLKLLNNFQGTSYPITIECIKCGYIRTITADTLLKTPVCTFCNKHTWSNGEKTIADFLDRHHIDYVHSFRPATLIDERELHFDFKIGNKLIEYQGQQHYQAIDYFGGLDNLRKQQKHDQMKRNWATQHNYELFEIRYDQNIINEMTKIVLNDNRRKCK